MKKLLIPLLFGLSACATFDEIENPFDSLNKDPINSNDAAAQFCVDMGGSVELGTNNQNYCRTKDGRLIKAWDYFLDTY